MSPSLTVVPPTGAARGSSSDASQARPVGDSGESRPDSRERRSESAGVRRWVCTRGEDGRYRTTPVRGIWLDGALVFRAGDERLAGAEPAGAPAAIVQLEDGERMTLMEGSASLVTEPTMLARFESELGAKYGVQSDAGDREAAVYALRV